MLNDTKLSFKSTDIKDQLLLIGREAFELTDYTIYVLSPVILFEPTEYGVR